MRVCRNVYAPGEYGGLEGWARTVAKMVLGVVVVGLLNWQGIADEDTDNLVSAQDAALWAGCLAIVDFRVFDFETKEEAELAPNRLNPDRFRARVAAAQPVVRAACGASVICKMRTGVSVESAITSQIANPSESRATSGSYPML